MKISIAASILILVVGAVIGRHDRQQLAALRTTQEHLIAKAAKLGVSSDRAQLTSRNRPARAAIAKLSITEVLELAKEIQRLNAPDGQNQQAIGALQLADPRQPERMGRHRIESPSRRNPHQPGS